MCIARGYRRVCCECSHLDRRHFWSGSEQLLIQLENRKLHRVCLHIFELVGLIVVCANAYLVAYMIHKEESLLSFQ